MKVAEWDELPIQEQLKYIDFVEQLFPDISSQELEKKAQKYYDHTIANSKNI